MKLKKYRPTRFDIFTDKIKLKQFIAEHGLQEYEHTMMESLEGVPQPEWAKQLKKNMGTLEELLKANPNLMATAGIKKYNIDDEEENEDVFTQEEKNLFSGKMDFTLSPRRLAERGLEFKADEKKEPKNVDETYYTKEEQALFERLRRDKEISILGEGKWPGMGGIEAPKSAESSGFVEPRTEQDWQGPKTRPRSTPLLDENKNTMDSMNRSNRSPGGKEPLLETPKQQFVENEKDNPKTVTDKHGREVVPQKELERQAKVKPKTKEEKQVFSKSFTSRRLEGNRHVSYADVVKELKKQKKAVKR